MGGAVSQIGSDIVQQNNAVDLARAEALKTEEFLGTQNQFDQDPDYVTFGERAPKATAAIVEKAANLIRDPRMRERWKAGAQGDAARVNDSIADRGIALGKQAEQVAFDDGLEANRRLYVDPDTPDDVREKARQDIAGSIDMGEASGLFTPEQARQRRDLFLDGADFNRAQLYAERTGQVPGDTDAAALLRRFEGFRPDPYWDVNADRVGYGSDTITRADGTVEKVTKGTKVTREDAERDLNRRIGEFQRGIQRDIGATAWSALPANAKAALTSVAYNYGSLPKSVVSAVQSGNMGEVANAVQALGSHNNGINAKRRGEEAAIIRGEGRPEWFKRLSPERQQVAIDTATKRQSQLSTQLAAQDKAAYEAYKDSFALNILTGGIASERQILDDPRLNDGDKTTLLRSFRTEMEGALATATAVQEFANGNLRVDPYDSDGRKTVDNVYDAVSKAAPENIQPITEELVRQSGIVPKQAMSLIRQGMTSTDNAAVAQAMQAAQRISTLNPAALSRREGGAEIQKAADDFSYYVNNLNMSVDDAAQRIREAQDPNRIRERKALEPAAKEFIKQIQGDDLGAVFDDSIMGWRSNPAVGFNEAQRLGIQAEYQAIAEQEFFNTGGNPDLAKNRAVETMKRLYGVTELSGKSVVMKHPPERYWPAMPGAADPFAYARDQIADDFAQFISDDDVRESLPSIALTSGDVTKTISDAKKRMVLDSLMIVSTPETDAMVKAGKLPGYFVGYVDPNGNIQTIPGKLFVPDISKAQEEGKRLTERELGWAREDDAEIRTLQDSPDGLRERSLDNFLEGP